MLGQIVNKQRRAVAVVKTALLCVGITGRSICVQVDSWADKYGHRENYAVFVGSPYGSNDEPFYTTGKSMVEAVKNMIASIKGKTNGAKAEVSEIAPF